MSRPYRCPRCVQEYGETGRPKDFGSDPECAFAPAGVEFNPDNWCCQTMQALRDLARKRENVTWFEDSNLGAVPFESDEIGCGFIVLEWYKSRGQTGVAVVVKGDPEPKRLTLAEAEAALKYHRIASSPLRRVK